MKKTLLKILSAPNGSFQAVRFASIVKPSAVHKNVKLEKKTSMTVRAGIDYANLATVREGIENGQRGEVKPLPWGEWERFPYTITHKGNRYVRLYPLQGKVKTTFFVDGSPVSREYFSGFLTPSESKKLLSGDPPDCLTIKEENLVD